MALWGKPKYTVCAVPCSDCASQTRAWALHSVEVVKKAAESQTVLSGRGVWGCYLQQALSCTCATAPRGVHCHMRR